MAQQNQHNHQPNRHQQNRQQPHPSQRNPRYEYLLRRQEELGDELYRLADDEWEAQRQLADLDQQEHQQLLLVDQQEQQRCSLLDQQKRQYFNAGYYAKSLGAIWLSGGNGMVARHHGDMKRDFTRERTRLSDEMEQMRFRVRAEHERERTRLQRVLSALQRQQEAVRYKLQRVNSELHVFYHQPQQPQAPVPAQSPVQQPQALVAGKRVVCSNCQQQVRPGAFCSRCGEALTSVKAPQPQPPAIRSTGMPAISHKIVARPIPGPTGNGMQPKLPAQAQAPVVASGLNASSGIQPLYTYSPQPQAPAQAQAQPSVQQATGNGKQCPNCQQEVRSGARFCGTCGKALPGAIRPPIQQQPSAQASQAQGGEQHNSDELELPESLIEQARQVVAQHGGKASISLLQRCLRIGYSRAARLVDLFEAEESQQTPAPQLMPVQPAQSQPSANAASQELELSDELKERARHAVFAAKKGQKIRLAFLQRELGINKEQAIPLLQWLYQENLIHY